MAKLPNANFPHDAENKYNLNTPIVDPTFQHPSNMREIESYIEFPPMRPCYVQPRQFNPNIPPPPTYPHPSPFPSRLHSVPPPSINESVGAGTRVNISPYLHIPHRQLHWDPAASHSGFSAGMRHLHSVETSESRYLVDYPVIPKIPAEQSQTNAPNPEICGGSVDIDEKRSVSCIGSNPDQEWVHSWLQSRAEEHRSRGVSVKCIKVWEIKKILQSCWSNLKELEKLEGEMTMRCKELGDCEWNKMLKEVELKKVLLRGHLGKIDNSALEHVKMMVLKRSKKRARRRRKSLFGERDGILVSERTKKCHLLIDTWLEKKLAEVDLQKREESMKQEADAVLWEVRLKQSEGRKILSLLNGLVKLYQLRASKNEFSENSESSETKEQFKKIIERLVHLWQCQMKDYEAEERTLRVMLQESPEKDKHKNVMNEMERRCREVEALLFGKDVAVGEGLMALGAATYLPFFLNQSKSGETLMKTRGEWDQFISNSPSASSIPIGWVEPQEASSQEWAELIKTSHLEFSSLL